MPSILIRILCTAAAQAITLKWLYSIIYSDENTLLRELFKDFQTIAASLFYLFACLKIWPQPDFAVKFPTIATSSIIIPLIIMFCKIIPKHPPSK